MMIKWTMRQSLLIILLLIFSIISPQGNVLSAQNNGKLLQAVKKDNVDLPYNSKWGWHKVHRKPLKVFKIGKSPFAPSRKIDVCFKCHQKNNYRICDPHTQINENGKIIVEKCLYCHQEKPDEKVAAFDKYRSEVKFNRNIEMICVGCHSGTQYQNAHPLNANHLRKPSDEMLSMMKRTEKQFDIILPLNLDGKIMCATCHNPHQKGVIPEERGAAGGASEKNRIRLPGQVESAITKEGKEEYMTRMSGVKDRICLACHKDKEIQKIQPERSIYNMR
ncbi:doubled CXXCH motif [bacterium BMS3Bbin09]|nr:doubled CXXCH motif [bacterium BMS3Bbin09]